METVHGVVGLYIGNRFVPIYGIFTVLAIIVASIWSIFLIKKEQESVDDFFLLLAYTGLGAYIGSKLLFVAVSFRQIDWTRLFQLDYFLAFMKSGFVYYGGMLGGLLGGMAGEKIHHIDFKKYLTMVISALPLGHAIGRVGCFLAGCCYGIPYSGIGAVIYHDLIVTPCEVPLFPVQLAEASLNIFIFVVLYVNQLRKGKRIKNILLYVILYGISRFFIEFFRYDFERRIYYFLSTSQWISLILVLIGFTVLFMKREKV